MNSLRKRWIEFPLRGKIIIFGILLVALPVSGVWIVSGIVYYRGAEQKRPGTHRRLLKAKPRRHRQADKRRLLDLSHPRP